MFSTNDKVDHPGAGSARRQPTRSSSPAAAAATAAAAKSHFCRRLLLTRLCSLAPMPQLLDQIFNLKFTSKQLVRAARKCEKEEKDEKLKIKKAIEKGA